MTARLVTIFNIYWKPLLTVFALTFVIAFSLFSVGGAILKSIPTTYAASDVNAQLVDLINAQRTKNGLLPLTINSAIEQAAAKHNSTMATCAKQYGINSCFSHQVTQLGEPVLYNRLVNAGFTPTAWEENIAWGYLSAQDTLNAWMNSTGHRENILSNTVSEIGCNLLDTNNGNYAGMYWTCDFGKGTGGSVVTVTSPTTPVPTPHISPTPLLSSSPVPVKLEHTITPSPTPVSRPVVIPSSTVISQKTSQTLTSQVFVSLYYKIVCTYWPSSSFCYV